MIKFPWTYAGASEPVQHLRHLPEQKSKENQRVYHSNASAWQIIICAYGFNFLRRDPMKRWIVLLRLALVLVMILLIPSKFHPPKSFLFPKCSKNEKRSFRPEWCEKYSWLHYDASIDTAFCYICMKVERESKYKVSTKYCCRWICSREWTSSSILWKVLKTSYNNYLLYLIVN